MRFQRMKVETDGFTGAMLGLAVGDALGYPVEFMKRATMPERLEAPSLFSDDTQLSIAVARALVTGERDLERFGEALAIELLAWENSPENNRAPGAACLAGCRTLRGGVAWREGGALTARGAGSVMRVTPIGLAFPDPDDVARFAAASSLPTHRHPAAICAAQGAALVVHALLHGSDFDEALATLERLDGKCGIFDETAERFDDFKDAAPEVALSREGIGDSWIGDEALFAALYVVRRHLDDFEGGVLEAVRIDGDSDTLGCIVGGMLGARLGLEAIPPAWLENLERRSELQRLGLRLFTRYHGFAPLPLEARP